MNDNTLTRTIRPGLLIGITLGTFAYMFATTFTATAQHVNTWAGLLQIVLPVIYGAYFAGRSYEKGKQC